VIDRPFVLVVRRDDEFSSLLRESGIEVLNLDLIDTEPVDDLSEFERKLDALEMYDGLFFTSPAAVEIFVNHSRTSGIFEGTFYALGNRSREMLERNEFAVVSPTNAKTANDLIASFDRSEFAGKRFLFVCGDHSLRTIPELLNEIADVDTVVVYKTVYKEVEASAIEFVKRKVASGEIRLVCFFSPSGVIRFCEMFGNANITAAAIGSTTAASAEKARLSVEMVSSRPDAAQFARELIQHIRNFE